MGKKRFKKNWPIPQGWQPQSALECRSAKREGRKKIINKPDDNPRYSLHRRIIEMVVNGIQLRFAMSTFRPQNMERILTKSLTTPSFSFNSCTRGLISMYSRTATYKLFKLASLQNRSGMSRTFDTRLTSRRNLKKWPVDLSASWRRSFSMPDSASCLGINIVKSDDSTSEQCFHSVIEVSIEQVREL